MKNLLNPLTLVFLIAGLMFKIQHWPGANILVILSAVGMLVSLGMAFQEGRGEMPARIYYVLNITLAVFIIGAIFRFMHWPGKNIIGSIAYILAVIMTIVLALNKDVFSINRRYFTVFTFFVLFLLANFPNNPLAVVTGSNYTTSEQMQHENNRSDSTQIHLNGQ
jgi:predicted ferric reductase